MEFTDAYKQTGPCVFSPNARFLAVPADYRLVIRDVLTLEVLYYSVVYLFLSCFPLVTILGNERALEMYLCAKFNLQFQAIGSENCSKFQVFGAKRNC